MYCVTLSTTWRNSMSGSAQYSIGDISHLTGVKTMTIRAWERRYGLLSPERTESGHRLYSEDDVTVIREIRFWLEKGISISKVKPFLKFKPSAANADSERFSEEIEQILHAVSHFNQAALNHILDDVIACYPMNIIAETFLPEVELSLNQANLDSQAPHAETSFFYIHFRQKIREFINHVQHQRTEKRFLFAKTEHPYDRMDLLLMASMLTTHGYNPLIIESPMEYAEIPIVFERAELDGVLFFSNHSGPAIAAVNRLNQALNYELIVVTERPDLWHNVPDIRICANRFDEVLQVISLPETEDDD